MSELEIDRVLADHVVAVEANMARVNDHIERDLYALTARGRIFSLHFDAGSTTTGQWVELPPVPTT